MATVTASPFANLKFTTAKKPAQVAPVQSRRNKLCGRIAEQIALATAKQNGTVFIAHKTRTVTDAETGETRKVEETKRVKTWWFESDAGKLMLSIKYGARTLELVKGKTAVEIGSASELVSTLEIIKAAAQNGELDQAMADASVKLRKGFGK